MPHLHGRTLTLLVVLAGLLVAAPPAQADAICGGGVTVAYAGATATCAYTTAGEATFTVPDGVTSLAVLAVGAPGADGTPGDGFGGTPGTGGRGARVTATLDVTPGQVLYVEVGGPGEASPPLAPCIASSHAGGAGGANGGGAGGPGRCNGFGGGGGGGASDVRTTPASAGGLTGLPGDPRLVVAVAAEAAAAR